MLKLIHAVNQCLRLGSFDNKNFVFIDRTSLTYGHCMLQENMQDYAIQMCTNEVMLHYLSTNLPSYIGAKHIILSTEDKAISKLQIHGGQFTSYEIHIHPFALIPVEDELIFCNNLPFSSIEYEISRWLFKSNSLNIEDLKVLITLLYNNYEIVVYEQTLQFLQLVFYHPKEFSQLDKYYKGYLSQILAWCELDTPSWLLDEFI